jgi:hypothetical protein
MSERITSKFLTITVPNDTGICKLMNEVRSAGSFMNKRAATDADMYKVILTEIFKSPKAISDMVIKERRHY